MTARTRPWAWAVSLLLVTVVGGCGESRQKPADPDQVAEARGRCLTLFHAASAMAKANGRPPRITELLPPSKVLPPDMQKAPTDPWGHSYEVWMDGETLRIRSWGPDGEAGTKDDIVHPMAD